MASDYGLNFGFRRSDESVRVSEGRFKTPVGSALMLGTAVAIDPATPGYLKVCAQNDPLVPGYSGLLVQEEIHLRGIYEVDQIDSFSLSVARPNKLSVITMGAGTKVWFRNTASQTRADGRSISSANIWVTTSIVVGAALGWNGTAWSLAASAAASWMTVTNVNVSAGYVEAVLIK